MSVDPDPLASALARARALEPTEAELATVLEAVAVRDRSRQRNRLGRGMALAAAALAALAAAAAAATGLIPVGEIVRESGFGGGRAVDQSVVARGQLPELGRWRITTFELERGDGVVPCVKLTLTRPRAADGGGPSTAGYCGWVSGFSELALGGRAAAQRRGRTVLFGTAPARARSVELTGRGRPVVVADVRGPAGRSGRGYWALAAPIDVAGARLRWRDARGRVGASAAVAHRFGAAVAATVVAKGTAPVAGRWALVAHDSRRLVVDGDLYSPEGLPCLRLRLRDRPNGTAPASGFCGVQPQTPGFARAQARIPGNGDREAELVVYGRAPERADAVELAVQGRTASVRTSPAPGAIEGRYWLIARPAPEMRGGRVRWVDRDGGKRGPWVDLLPW